MSVETETLEVLLTINKETKNTYRYGEYIEYDMPVFKYVYIQKEALEVIGTPERIKITVEPA